MPFMCPCDPFGQTPYFSIVSSQTQWQLVYFKAFFNCFDQLLRVNRPENRYCFPLAGVLSHDDQPNQGCPPESWSLVQSAAHTWFGDDILGRPVSTSPLRGAKTPVPFLPRHR